uniref:Penicillin-binding protein n=1 Tax=candidate division CPR3 bacterium TaxID=2268181 RepID=A0A7C4M2K4_UNCC3
MYIPKKRFKLFSKKRKLYGDHYSFSSNQKTKDPEKRKKIIKKLVYTGIFGILFIASLFVWYSKDLPNPYKINRDIAQSTKILDRNGNLLYEVHGEENRTLIKYEDIPENIKKATVSVEDPDFYKHMGFNIRGIGRAFIQDIISRDAKQGGSTITQQFVKNALLTSEKSISRKIKEFILSIEIEKIYSKNEILTMYLNEIPYGNNAYGISAAAKTYFDKDPKDLSLAESAVLASLPQAPSYFNPYGSNKDALMAKKDFVLNKMASLDLINKEEAEEAKKEEIKFTEQNEGILAPHFVMYVKELLAEKFGESKLQAGGFVVTTSLDIEKQKIAEEVMVGQKDYMKSKGASNASLVSMDPKTGEILAMVGSMDYFDTENDGNVNVSVRLRQPGSSLKPLIYAAAFEKGYSPATMLMDVETDFGQGYKPQNYDRIFRGPVSIRQSLGNSLNIPAVKVLALVGVKEATDFVQRLGLKSLNDPDRYGLSLVLGGGEVKLLELVHAYSVLANEGIKHEIRPILKITDNNGKVLEEYKKEDDKGERVLDENIAYMVSNVMSDDSARAAIFGMGGVLTLPGRPVAAKTGTTDEYRDAWTVGYTPSLVTAVWAGNNDNSPMNAVTSGITGATPIWHNIMAEILKNNAYQAQFIPPKELVPVQVCRDSGVTTCLSGCKIIKTEYFMPGNIPAIPCVPPTPQPKQSDDWKSNQLTFFH